MKKIALVGLIVVAVGVMLAPPSEAHGRRFGHRSGFRSSVVIGFGPSYYWGPPPYWYYSPPYVVYSSPPVIVQEAPPVYVQQPPAPPAPPESAEHYWYYCQSAGAYYPTVPSCAEAWVKVPPRP